jgi:hypothetical protein
MRRAVLALVLVAVTALGFVVFNMGTAGAWKCNVHPEQPTCTTLPPPTVPNTTERTTTTEPPVTYTVPSTTPEPSTSTSTSTSTSVPPDDPPTTAIRFAG